MSKSSSSSSSSSSSKQQTCELYCGERAMANACCSGGRAGAGGAGGASKAHFACAPCLLQWLRANAKSACPVCAGPLAAAGLDELVRHSRRGKAKAGALRPVGADKEARWRAGGRAPLGGAAAGGGSAKTDPRSQRRLKREFKSEGSKPCPRCSEAVTHCEGPLQHVAPARAHALLTAALAQRRAPLPPSKHKRLRRWLS